MTVAASAASPTGSRLGAGFVTICYDLGEDLNIRNLADVASIHVVLDLLNDFQHARGWVVLVQARLEPARNGGATAHTILVLVVFLGVSSLSSLRILQTLGLTLSSLKSPVLQNTITPSVILDIIVGPPLYLIDLQEYKVDLAKRIVISIAVSRALVVLSAVVYPDMSRDRLCTELVATKDVGNGLSKSGTCGARLDKHACRLLRLRGCSVIL